VSQIESFSLTGFSPNFLPPLDRDKLVMFWVKGQRSRSHYCGGGVHHSTLPSSSLQLSIIITLYNVTFIRTNWTCVILTLLWCTCVVNNLIIRLLYYYRLAVMNENYMFELETMGLSSRCFHLRRKNKLKGWLLVSGYTPFSKNCTTVIFWITPWNIGQF